MSEPKRGGGPMTPEGKKRCSLNALKHGLTARSPQALDQLAEQSGLPFDDVLAEMTRHYAPTDPVEKQLVMRIARCIWRLSLSAAMEQRLLERRPEAIRPSSTYDRILKYERLVDIHLHRALSALERKRDTTNRQPPDTNWQNRL